MKTHSVIETRGKREAKALWLELNEYESSNDVVAYRSRSQWWFWHTESSIPLDLDALESPDQLVDVLYTFVHLAWPEHLVNLCRLPDGSAVWRDGERRIKRGGRWCVLAGENYWRVSKETTQRCLPKAWLV